jgi:hypothetical protein
MERYDGIRESRKGKPEDLAGTGTGSAAAAAADLEDGYCRYQYGSSSMMMTSYFWQTR